MPLSNAVEYPIWVNALTFLAAAVIVWSAGTRLTRYLDAIAQKTGLGQAFVGMLLLGTITSLPEVANVVTSSLTDNPRLGVNNLLGSAAINVLLLAIADAIIGRDAVTSVVVKPSTLMMGTLCILLLITHAAAVVVGDRLIFGLGIGAIVLCLMSIAALWIAASYDDRARWTIKGKDKEAEPEEQESKASLKTLIVRSAVAALVIFVAGYTLSQTGDALAEQTGVGTGMVGFALIGLATSMPELSSIITALRLRRYEMAFGQVLGTNFINLSLILVADIFFSGDPVINELGRFEILSALLGAILTSLFMVGLLEQRNPKMMRMGYFCLWPWTSL
jgi:cation:H+ antiporter